MFKELKINSYRGLSQCAFSDLKRINIIIGENNSGKTSVLEAIQLFDNRDVLSNIISIARQREPQLYPISRNRLLPFDMLLYSFAMQEKNKEIAVSAYNDEDIEYHANVQIMLGRQLLSQDEMSPSEWERYKNFCDEDDTVRAIHGNYYFKDIKKKIQKEFVFNETQQRPVIIELEDESDEEVQHDKSLRRLTRSREILYISPLDLYTNRVISASLYRGMLVEEKDRLLELMRMFDERIMGVETGIQYRNMITYIEMEDAGLVPISLFGDGLKKVLTLASAIVRMRGKVVLIDEFETGIHKRALVQVAKWLTAVAERYNVQVFLTTHSREAIDALVAVQEDYNNISAYRLDHYKSKIYVKQFPGEDLYQFTTNQGMDIL